MKTISSAIKASALSLILLTGSAYAHAQNLSESKNSTQPRAQQVSDTVIAANAYKPGVNRVTFQSEGETLVGNLYLPANYKPGDKLPAAIVAGSWTTVKEQMPATYARKLAEQGFAALAFDFRFFGESGGKVRSFESPTAKIADIKNAVSFLQTVDAVDSKRIAGLGICASAGYMAVATATDSRIKSFVAVAPWIHDAAIVNTIYGGENAVQEKIKSSQAARVKFEQTGKAEYVPAISTTNKQAAMYGNVDYYLNSKRGAIPQWANQFAVMSWAEWLTFSAMPQAKQIKVPTLFIHSEKAAIPDGARQFFAAIPGDRKSIVWFPEAQQFDFYDREATINQAVALTVKQLRTSL
ncbi:alpha/beta fold hydrolase [Scytonema sp. UIC 10036]|uniref:alpha/beta hydrolase n=1 Tax=Scytonema sp. UIC 10036 TaxID=2304196 RepID=UPI0012DA48D6|nr:alpha/beta hydrolase [Scytonema sp. UIC 10036]MUG98721.1 alpha/beta fold hydrolase [Scytonema sp. UIC 10036]